MHRRAVLVALGVLLLLSPVACAQQGPVGTPEGEWRAQVYLIPLPHDGGHAMHTLVLRPKDRGPQDKDKAPLVVINHGSPANAGERPGMKPGFRSA